MITVEQSIKWIEDRYTFSENIACKNAWQTLKTAALAQQTNNSATDAMRCLVGLLSQEGDLVDAVNETKRVVSEWNAAHHQ